MSTEIKPKVYKVLIDHHPVLLKGYRRPNVLKQQISFFEEWKNAESIAARPLPFPTGEMSISKLGCEWGLFTWKDGRHADFGNEMDRKKTYNCLKQFHRNTKGINTLSIPRDPLYLKWYRRLEQFSDTKHVFHSYYKKELYEEVFTMMDRLLDVFASYPWGQIEENSWNSEQWLHGDVAHHNFIIDSVGSVSMIDFDLLHRGPKLYDEIQLAHRFLPYLENDRINFFQLFKHVSYPEIWLRGSLVPADLIREWLYGYNKSRRGEEALLTHIEKFEKAWERRKQFVRYVEFMLR